jgi:sugar lactone lactonase YvrE
MEAVMTYSLSFFALQFRRMTLGMNFLIASLLLPMAAQAQVTFSGAQPSVNVGSQAVGTTSTATTLNFSIAANTTVGSIGVLTTGFAGLDFVQAAGSTCTATSYAAATNCTINVGFTPLAAGLRRGAVVFYAGAVRTSAALVTVPVYGVGTGPQLVFRPGAAQSSVGSKLVSPEGVAVDGAGNVYIADIALQQVFKVSTKGKQTAIGSGLQVPGGVAVDGAGNVYIADSQADAVFKVTPGGVQTTIGSGNNGFSYPSGIAVDGAGNVYVSDPFIPTVFEITPAGGTPTMIGSGYNTPAGVAVDAAGNVYVADSYNAAVFMITPGGTQTTISNGLLVPAAVAVDAAGNLYVTDTGTNSLYQITPAGVTSTLRRGLAVPNGIAVGARGDLYLANSFNEQVLRIDRTAPAELHFDATKINTTSADSPRTVSLENIGNVGLQFSAIEYATDFPEGNDHPDTDCTASTLLASSTACTLTIDFSPVTALGGKTSTTLTEAVKLTTNNGNVTNTHQQVTVTGEETQ